MLAVPVIDRGGCFNFPNTHPLDLSGAEAELLASANLTILSRKTFANPGTALTIQTLGALDAVTNRLTISGGVATAVATWSAITHSGLNATSPTITGTPTAAGATWADLGSVTTIDINGGTIDGVTITSPTLAGTLGGTYTIGGVPTLGATLALGGQTLSGNATASGAVNFTGTPVFTAAGSTATFTSTENAVSAQVARLEGTKGVGVVAANDEAFLSLRLKNSVGQQEFNRITWRATNVTDASEDSVFRFGQMSAGTLRTLTTPAITADDTLVAAAFAQTLTNKSLTSPSISGPTLSGTIGGTYNIGGTPTLTAGLALNGQTLSGAATFTGDPSFTGTTTFTNLVVGTSSRLDGPVVRATSFTTKSGVSTISASELTGSGLIVNTVTGTLTTATAALILAALTGEANDDTFAFAINSAAAVTTTLAGGTNVTVSTAAASIPADTTEYIVCRIIDATGVANPSITCY